MRMRTLSTLLALALTLSACTIPGLSLPGTDTPTPDPVIETGPAPSSTPDVPALTLAQLKNAEYRTSFYPGEIRVIQLTDGKFESTKDLASPDYAVVTLGDKVAFGDLDGDGVQDAVVTLAENYGGSGVFVSVATVLNQGGQPQHAASARVDDRPIIESLAISNGQIELKATIHSFQDPMCCPSFKMTESLRLTGNALVLTRFTSFTPDGKERIISIDTPADGTDVSGLVELDGRVTIAPFENTLVYNVYDRGSKEIASGPLMVASDGLGGPGTFHLSLDFAALPAYDATLVTISETSAADGSLLVLASVLLNVKY